MKVILGGSGLYLEQKSNGYYKDEEASNELVVYRSENMEICRFKLDC